MIDFTFLVSYGAGGDIGNMLAAWERAGVFSYLLPFLLIFALIFGILSQMKMFQENRAINGIISLTVALMTLQFDTVSIFFSEIFPSLGVALSVILVAMILLGLFMPSSAVPILFVIGAIAFLVVIINSFGSVGWNTASYWFSGEHLTNIVFGIIVIVIVIIAFVSKKSPSSNSLANDSLFAQLIKPSH